MTAEAIAGALGGRRVGSGWMAPCPAHDDRKPSLAIHEGEDGKVLIKCHAGCEQARVIEALRARGLWSRGRWDRAPMKPRPVQPHVAGRARQGATDRAAMALRIWRETTPAEGTPVEHYLRSRGIAQSAPAAVRFHPALRHPCGGRWPAMVALVTRGNDEAPVAIHRTYLTADGSGKASVEPSKMMLGPCRGGAVRLADPLEIVMVGEGLETCLAAMQSTGTPTWAALSTSGLRSIDLPPEIREVVVLADGDAPGEAAALQAGRRLRRQGRHVRIARPPTGFDFNDLLLGIDSRHREVKP